MLYRIGNFIKTNRDQNWFCVAVIFVASCYVILPLILLGIPRGADLTQHLQFASTYQQAILSGDFFPGWASTDNYGFGSIGIRFYPPVAYYLMALTQMLTGNWYDTFWLNALFWVMLGSLGLYLWAREWLTPNLAMTAAVFYAFAPYHRYQLFKLILFAEFAAAGILPFCFWFLTRTIRRGRAVDVILLALSLTLLILTHIPTTILGTIGLAIYGLLIIERRQVPQTIFKLAAAGILAAAASSYHWLRLMTELSLVKHTAANYTVDFYDYRQHLFPIAEQLRNYMPPLDEAVILLILCFFPLALILTWGNRVDWKSAGEKKFAAALFLTGAVSVFMTTGASRLIWENFGFLQKVQFPWRWMAVGTVVAPLALVLSISQLYKSAQSVKKHFAVAGAILFGAVFLYYLYFALSPPMVLDRQDFANEVADLQNRKGCACWWPNTAEASAFGNRDRVSADQRAVTIGKWESEAREFEVEPGQAQKIRIATFDYPHWRASVNDVPAKIETAGDGTISVPVGPDRATVKLAFVEPVFLQTALAASVATWLFLIISLFYFRQRKPLRD